MARETAVCNQAPEKKWRRRLLKKVGRWLVRLLLPTELPAEIRDWLRDEPRLIAGPLRGLFRS
jgi:hypothetical protein